MISSCRGSMCCMVRPSACNFQLCTAIAPLAVPSCYNHISNEPTCTTAVRHTASGETSTSSNHQEQHGTTQRSQEQVSQAALLDQLDMIVLERVSCGCNAQLKLKHFEMNICINHGVVHQLYFMQSLVRSLVALLRH